MVTQVCFRCMFGILSGPIALLFLHLSMASDASVGRKYNSLFGSLWSWCFTSRHFRGVICLASAEYCLLKASDISLFPVNSLLLNLMDWFAPWEAVVPFNLLMILITLHMFFDPSSSLSKSRHELRPGSISPLSIPWFKTVSPFDCGSVFRNSLRSSISFAISVGATGYMFFDTTSRDE